jgi:hypothetical protein
MAADQSRQIPRAICLYGITLIFREMGIKDPSLVDILETALSWPTLLNFVCQNQSDYAKFSDIFHDHKYAEYGAPEGGWGVNVTGNPGRTLDEFQPTMSREDLTSLGFDGFLSELFEAPDVVMVAILNRSNAHKMVWISSCLICSRIRGRRLIFRLLKGIREFSSVSVLLISARLLSIGRMEIRLFVTNRSRTPFIWQRLWTQTVKRS